MPTLIVCNVSSESEIPVVKGFSYRFGTDFRIVTNLNLGFGRVWKMESMAKTDAEWTRRFMRKFMDENYSTLLKIDPDTKIKSLPAMPAGCDVAGDFRQTNLGWLWLGAFQYFTRSAVEKILADPLYTGSCLYQDVSLASSVRRLGLKACNMEEVDGWCGPDSNSQVTHRGRALIERNPAGPIILT